MPRGSPAMRCCSAQQLGVDRCRGRFPGLCPSAMLKEAAGPEWTAGAARMGGRRLGHVVAAVPVRRVVVPIALDARPRTPPVGPTAPGASPVTRDAFSHGWVEDAVPRIASGSGYDGVERGWPPGRVTQRRRGAGAGEGSPVSAVVGGPARWPVALQAWAREPGGGQRGGGELGHHAACWWCGCGWRPPDRQRSLPTPGRAGPVRASRPDSSAGAGPARPGG